jgi:hypothetical protein
LISAGARSGDTIDIAGFVFDFDPEPGDLPDEELDVFDVEDVDRGELEVEDLDLEELDAETEPKPESGGG